VNTLGRIIMMRPYLNFINMLKIEQPFFEKLIAILSNHVLTNNHHEIESLYMKWSSQFSDDLKILPDIFRKDLVSKKQNLPPNNYLNGIDLPTWFGNFQSKKVLFLGIDPMRHENDFQKSNANISEDVIVGTPYAFHLKGFREKRTSAYWQVINEVAKSNFIYVTDIYKTFFYTDISKKTRSYDFFNEQENNDLNKNHRQLLIEEINLIQPDLIVTFGAVAYKVLTNQKYCHKLSESLNSTTNQIKNFTYQKENTQDRTIKVLPLMHLSGATRSHNLEEFFKNNNHPYSDREDKRDKVGQLYGQIINGYLDNIK